jgi:hypothetical protein
MLYQWLMGVAADDNLDIGRTWVDVKVMDGVDHVEQPAPKLNGLRCRKGSAGAMSVYVAPNCCDRCDLAESRKYVCIAYVARVQNMFGFGQRNQRFGSQQAMCI